jgi:3-hydroxybutyrate dehydrogenase
MLHGLGDRAANEKLRSELEKKYGVLVGLSGADLSKVEEISSLISETQSVLGGLDILVNNAGIQHVSAIEEFPPEKWDLILAASPRMGASREYCFNSWTSGVGRKVGLRGG